MNTGATSGSRSFRERSPCGGDSEDQELLSWRMSGDASASFQEFAL